MIDENGELRDLPTMIRNSLWSEGILTLAALQSCTKNRLRDLPNIGAQSVNTVIEFLAARGLTLAGKNGSEPLRVPQSVPIPFDLLQRIDACRGDEGRSAFVSRILDDALKVRETVPGPKTFALRDTYNHRGDTCSIEPQRHGGTEGAIAPQALFSGIGQSAG